MKPFTPLQLFQLISLLVMTYGLTAQTIYVKSDASGANDGSTWENAFTDFGEALNNAQDSDMVWIASGIYHPGGSNPNTSSVFAVRNNVSIYGGFNGTETNLEDRDPIVNITVLSGDINDDDIVDDFTNNKSDNTIHVVFVDSLLDLIIIDGLTIEGGNTIDNVNASIYNRSGGGIHALSPVVINQCHMTGNFGRAGGGIYLDSKASSSSVTNCTFSHNKTSSRGAGLFGLSASDIQISNCNFNHNITVRGSLCFITCKNVDVNDCLFENNINTISTTNSSGVGSFDNYNLSIRNSVFIGNSAQNGGAIVVNGSQIPLDTFSNIRIEHCSFEGNNAVNWGAAIYLFTNPDIAILNCKFIDNTAANAVAVGIEQPAVNITDTNNIRIDSCLFRNNSSTDKGGGAMWLKFTSAKVEHCLFDANTTSGLNNGGGGHVFVNSPGKNVIFRNDSLLNGTSFGYAGAATAYGKNAQFLFENCVFSGNKCDLLGGAVHHNAASYTTYKNCKFEENSSELRGGGALSLEGDSTSIHTIQSQFISNRALLDGGAIFSGLGSGHLMIDQCSFESNYSVAGFGGAVFAFEGGDDDIGSVNITNSRFGFNQSNFKGGAVYVGDSDMEITSSLFYYNNCLGDGYGGAVSIFASENDTMEASILNTTFAYNLSGHSDQLSQNTDSFEALLSTTIQNCIFTNPGLTNYIVEGGTPLLLSLDGNMSDDQSLNAILIQPKDRNQVSPLFNDEEMYDFSLKSNSPGIDGGVTPAPEFDIIGNPRVNAPDMGAYENQMPVRVKENRHSEKSMLTVYPNPVRDQNPTAMLMNAWRGDIKVQLSDLSGRIVFSDNIVKSDEQHQLMLHMQNLNAGSYQLLVSNGQKSITGSIVKMQ